jgi:hypothetical protein
MTAATTTVMPIRSYHSAADGTFRKAMRRRAAIAEVRAYHAVAGHLPVPQLAGIHWTVRGAEVVYEDVFASGRCHRLLADTINTADRDPTQTFAVRLLIDGICDSILATLDITRPTSRLADCVPALYASRLAPGGRIDRWYAPPRPMWIVDSHRLSLGGLAAATLVIDGKPHRSAFAANIDQLRQALSPDARWTSTVSQGDPTEPNIAEPLCWLDFEHAGRNALAGDLAVLIWYLLAMGGWLVPTYRPTTYTRTLTAPVPPLAEPRIDHLHIAGRHIEINYSWTVGTGRHAAMQALLDRLADDLGATLHPLDDPLDVLRPFLAMRVLSVIPLAELAGPHALLCLAKLAELTHPDTTLRSWCTTMPVAP